MVWCAAAIVVEASREAVDGGPLPRGDGGVFASECARFCRVDGKELDVCKPLCLTGEAEEEEVFVVPAKE